MNDIAVIGIGNLLLQDEGVGVHAIQMLQRQYDYKPAINLIDGGTTGLDLIPLVENCEKVLFIDAMDLKKTPGSIVELRDDEIQFQLNTKMSLHHLGLQDLLATLKLIEKSPPAIHLIGIQPYSIETGIDLSEEMTIAIESLITLAVSKLQSWGIVVYPTT